MTDAERQVLDHIDTEGLVEAVAALVRIPSAGGFETAAQSAMADFMAESGLEVDRWPIDLESLKAHPHFSYEIDRDAALGVVGVLQGSADGPVLILNGHVDVVPAGDSHLWTRDPYSGDVANGRIHGRGALDMKGPLLSGLFALRAIARSGVRLRGSAKLQSVVGEEDGGLGTLAAIERGHLGDAAIVLEPTEMRVAHMGAGCLNFRVRLGGRAAHGAFRMEGRSAIAGIPGLLTAVEEVERTRNQSPPPGFDDFEGHLPFPISVGRVAGGDWPSSVADWVTLEGRIGVRPDETFSAARTELETAVAEAWRAEPGDPPSVEWWGGRYLPLDTPVDARVVQVMHRAHRELGGPASRPSAVPYGSDAGLLSTVGGMPTVLFGAGDIREAHRPDESIEVHALVQMTRVLALTVLRFCDAED